MKHVSATTHVPRQRQPFILVENKGDAYDAIGTAAVAATVLDGYNFDVVATSKAKKGVSYVTASSDSLGHLAAELLGRGAGLAFQAIPHKGGGHLENDAAAAHVPLAIGSVFLVKPHLESMESQSIDVLGGTPEAARVLIWRQMDVWAKVVKENIIQADEAHEALGILSQEPIPLAIAWCRLPARQYLAIEPIRCRFKVTLGLHQCPRLA